DYMLFGKLTGLRTIKGDDINYIPEDKDSGSDGSSSPEDSGWNIIKPQEPKEDKDRFIEIDGIKRRKKRFFPEKDEDKKSKSSHKNNHYKTNNLSLDKKRNAKKPPAE